MSLMDEAQILVMRNLVELNMLTGKVFAPVYETELETMRGVIQASYYRCKRCNMLVCGYSDTVGTFRPRYCSNCGAKVAK